MNRLLSIMSAMAVCFCMSAQRHIVINKNDVNLRSESSASASVVKKAKKGTVLELLDSKPGWFKAKSYEGDSENVWVATSVAAKVEDWNYNTPYMTAAIVALPDTELGYEIVTKFKNGESHDVWFISSDDPKYWESEAEVRSIVARNADTAIYNIYITPGVCSQTRLLTKAKVILPTLSLMSKALTAVERGRSLNRQSIFTHH